MEDQEKISETHFREDRGRKSVFTIQSEKVMCELLGRTVPLQSDLDRFTYVSLANLSTSSSVSKEVKTATGPKIYQPCVSCKEKRKFYSDDEIVVADLPPLESSEL